MPLATYYYEKMNFSGIVYKVFVKAVRSIFDSMGKYESLKGALFCDKGKHRCTKKHNEFPDFGLSLCADCRFSAAIGLNGHERMTMQGITIIRA